MLPNGTRFHINDMLYYSKSKRNLFSFKDICINGYHIETMNEANIFFFILPLLFFGKKLVDEKLSSIPSGLYHTTIKPIKSYVVMNQKFNDLHNFIL